MSELRTIGLTSLKIGAVAVDGGMGTTLALIGNIYKDSCELSQEDASVTDIEAEEVDDPVESIEILGKRTLKFSIMDYSPDTLIKVLGGTVTAGPPKVWNAPTTSPNIEQSIEIITPKGVKINIVRCKVMAKITAKFSKTGVALVDVTCKILTPTKAATAPIMITTLT